MYSSFGSVRFAEPISVKYQLAVIVQTHAAEWKQPLTCGHMHLEQAIIYLLIMVTCKMGSDISYSQTTIIHWETISYMKFQNKFSIIFAPLYLLSSVPNQFQF